MSRVRAFIFRAGAESVEEVFWGTRSPRKSRRRTKGDLQGRAKVREPPGRGKAPARSSQRDHLPAGGGFFRERPGRGSIQRGEGDDLKAVARETDELGRAVGKKLHLPDADIAEYLRAEAVVAVGHPRAAARSGGPAGHRRPSLVRRNDLGDV